MGRCLAHAGTCRGIDFFEQLPTAVVLEDVDIVLLADIGVELLGIEPCAPVELDVIVAVRLAGHGLGVEERLVEQHAGLEAVAILIIIAYRILIEVLGVLAGIPFSPAFIVDGVGDGVIPHAAEAFVGHEQGELGQCRSLVVVQLDVVWSLAHLEHRVAVMLHALDVSVVEILGLELRIARRDNLVGHADGRTPCVLAARASLGQEEEAVGGHLVGQEDITGIGLVVDAQPLRHQLSRLERLLDVGQRALAALQLPAIEILRPGVLDLDQQHGHALDGVGNRLGAVTDPVHISPSTRRVKQVVVFMGSKVQVHFLLLLVGLPLKAVGFEIEAWVLQEYSFGNIRCASALNGADVVMIGPTAMVVIVDVALIQLVDARCAVGQILVVLILPRYCGVGVDSPEQGHDLARVGSLVSELGRVGDTLGIGPLIGLIVPRGGLRGLRRRGHLRPGRCTQQQCPGH